MIATLRTAWLRVTPAKIEHEYQLSRGETRLATGRVTLAVIDRQGHVCPIPPWLQEEEV